ncbi:hypothetical protein KI387_025087, partial [Taxus chinensis]
GEWNITLEDVYHISGVPIIRRQLMLETAGSRAQIAQWASYMGDAVISIGSNKG